MNTVAIAGVGLIGGSFALALRKAGFAGKILGISSPATIAKALERGVIDAAGSWGDADCIYLSQPISQILETLDALDTDALITDAGSTKALICERAAKLRRGRFIGGHPMAGKESRGVEHADADLFRGRPYILTGRDAELEKWIERIGARLVILDPQEHDRLVALVSHLPQLVSTALAATIGDAGKLAGPAALDLTRLALSPYDIWRDIFATNAVYIDTALTVFIAKLEDLRAQLRSPEMERIFAAAAASARSIRIPQS